MAELEEVRSKLKARLSKYKIQTPTRVAYLGDGRGNAASNMVPPGEPDKFWARESLDGDKPFKVLNRTALVTPAFNLPVLLGYPEDDPTEEQVMGLHRALIQFSTGNAAGSSLGGVPPHHIKHEWGGGDEVFVDPRMFKPGLVKPTAPAGMTVKILSFQHYWNSWKRFDGKTTDDLSAYKPSSDYRYVLLTLEPDSNEIRIRPGNVFTPDLSIDSIISNNANNTFRHIPVPPADEIPLGVILLEPNTAKIDWNPNGVNNLLPMRILLGAPLRQINERITLLEASIGVTSLPTTGAENSTPTISLPARIEGNTTRIVLHTVATSATMPALFVGEIGYVNDSPSRLIIGTASGNILFNPTGGGGAATLGDLDDVNIPSPQNQNFLKYDAAASLWIAASALGTLSYSSALAINYPDNEITVNARFYARSGDITVVEGGGTLGAIMRSGAGLPATITTQDGDAFTFGGADGSEGLVELNSDGPVRFVYYEQNGNPAMELDPANTNWIFFNTADRASAIIIDYDSGDIILASSANASMLVIDSDLGALQVGTSVAGQIADFRGHQTLFNKNKNDQDFVFSSSANASMLVVDGGLGAVQIGTSVAGQILDARGHLIDINKNGNNQNFRIRGTSSSSLFFTDAGANALSMVGHLNIVQRDNQTADIQTWATSHTGPARFTKDGVLRLPRTIEADSHDYPLTNQSAVDISTHFDDNFETPAGWTTVDSANISTTASAYSYWYLQGTNTDTSWKFRKQAGVNLEASGSAGRILIGPIYVFDGKPNADVDYYLGIYANSASAGATSIDEGTYIRAQFQWNAAGGIWRIRGEQRDSSSGSAFSGPWDTFSVPLPMPIYITVLVTAGGIGIVRYGLGPAQIGSVPIGTTIQSSSWNTYVNFNNSFVQFSQVRSTGATDRILIGALEYQAR